MTIENAELKLSMVKGMLKIHAEKLAKALEDMKTDPAYAAEWSGAVLATARVAGRLGVGIADLEDRGATPEGIVASLIREGLSGVFRGSVMNSTSMTANAASVYIYEFNLKLLDCMGVNAHRIAEALIGSAE